MSEKTGKRTSPTGNPAGRQAAEADTPPWNALWVLALGLAMIVLDGSIVNVTIPTIINEIHISLTDAQWITSLYSIVLAALLLPFGKLGDIHGRRTVLQVGVVIFVLSSLLAASSQGSGLLLASRALQGIGGAMIMPTTLSTVSATFRGKYRAAAFGVWGAVMSAAAAIGPLLGGLFTQTIGWRWIFLVNVPLGLIVFVGSVLFVPQSGGRQEGVKAGFDPLGVVLSALGSALLLFGLIEGETYGWWKPNSELTLGALTWGKDWPISPIPCCLLLGFLFFGAFALVESKRGRIGKPVMLDLSLFRIHTFSWGNLAAAAIAAGEFVIVFVLPLYLINARQYSTLGAGGMIAGLAVGSIVAGGLARLVSAKIGPGGTVQLGLVLEIIGVVILIVLMPAKSSALLLLAPLVIYGFGLGLASAQLTSLVLSQVPIAQSGEGSATQSTVRQLGTGLGAAVAGTSLAVALHAVLPGKLEVIEHLPQRIADGLTKAVSSSAGNAIGGIRSQGTNGKLGGLGPQVVDAMTSGFIQAGQWAMGIACVLLLIGLVASIKVRSASKQAGI
ncbi:MFS transporter [Bifidobacterium aemilianum]|uniref:MFS transporter n=1 Tax=Bifidobacterium aemilianum TaxID=2493120 RepID=A0A366K842_9BIFI|nr:MFS transporter [Bifidobacterium aemilianum]RBP97839.1 MFS transporter [Bifidobacterium aemilianum]